MTNIPQAACGSGLGHRLLPYRKVGVCSFSLGVSGLTGLIVLCLMSGALDGNWRTHL